MFHELSSLLNEALSKDIHSLWLGFWLFAIALILFTPALTWICYRRAIASPVNEDALPGRVRWVLLIGVAIPAVVLYTTGFTVWNTLLLVLAVISGGILLFRSLAGCAGLIAIGWISVISMAIDRIVIARSDLVRITAFPLSQRVCVVSACDSLLLGVLLLEIVVVCYTAFAFRLFALRKTAPAQAEMKEEESAFADAKGEVKSKVLAIVIIAALLVPTFLVNLPGYLSKGSAALNNSYIETINDYLDNHEITSDPQWQNTYATAYAELESFHLRPFDINIRRVSRNNINYLEAMSQASLLQIWSMQEMDAAIAAGASNEVILEAAAAFNASNDLMLSAAAEKISLITAGGKSLIRTFLAICTDSFRFYTSVVPLWLLAAILVALSALIFFVFRKAQQYTGADSANQGAFSFGILGFSKKQSVFNAILVIVMALLFVIGVTFGTGAEKTYGELLSDGVLRSGSQVMSDLLTAENEETLAQSIDAQILSLDSFLAVEDPEDAEQHTILCEKVKALKNTLYSLSGSIASGQEITKEQTMAYLLVETELLMDSLEIIIGQSVDQVAELVG